MKTICCFNNVHNYISCDFRDPHDQWVVTVKDPYPVADLEPQVLSVIFASVLGRAMVHAHVGIIDDAKAREEFGSRGRLPRYR